LQNAAECTGEIFSRSHCSLYPTAPCRHQRDTRAIGSGEATKSWGVKDDAFWSGRCCKETETETASERSLQ